MAVTPRNLKTSTTVGAYPRIVPTKIEARTFAADAGAAAVELPVGCPVAFNTSTDLWVPWVNGGANSTNDIRGVVFPKPITIFATGGGETVGAVMLRGEIHIDDFVLLAAQGTAAQLKVRLQDGGQAPTPRELGLDISGLNKVI